MIQSDADSCVVSMLREVLERQRRCDERVESLELSMAQRTPPSRSELVEFSSADTVPLAKLRTPPLIGWSNRNESSRLPALVTPVINKTKSGGVMQTPAPRPTPLPSPEATPPPVNFRPPSPAAFTSPPSPYEELSKPLPCGERKLSEEYVAKLELLLGESELRRRAADEQLARYDGRVADLENQLQQARRLETVGRFVAGIAHDFNNLLTLICGNAELIRDAKSDLYPQGDAAEQIIAAGQSAAGLTRQLLSLSRPTSSEPRVLDLNCVVRSAERMIQRLVGEGLNVTFHPAANVELIHADPLHVEQMLFNLAANARDAIGSGTGAVVIRTSNTTIEPDRPHWPSDLRRGAYVSLTFIDTGSGMSEEVKSRLFEPFFTTKAATQGTGLGLANVRESMRLVGGHVEVESTAGWGTSIRLYWPRIASFEEPRREEPITPISAMTLGRGETLLVVEDDRQVRDLLSVTLQQAGYRVLEAADADTAEERSRLFAGPIALLIADIGLPGRDGRQLAGRLRSTRPDLLVLYTSGYSAPEPLPDEANGQFLPKPYMPQKVLEVVRRALGDSHRDD